MSAAKHSTSHNAVEGESTLGQLQELAHSANSRLKEYGGKAKAILHTANNTSLADVESNVARYIRQNPARCLLGAAAVGLAIGYFLRRK